MQILITGVAGFIGHALAIKLLKYGFEITGIDNLNAYYSVKFKKDRLKLIQSDSNASKFQFIESDVRNEKLNLKIPHPDIIIHLAAEVGVRNSLLRPVDYLDNNIFGFFKILELANKTKPLSIIYASTSSVYGNNKSPNTREIDTTDKPLQFYAVTKKTNELMAHAFTNLYGIQTLGLRFFTVYGPMGRPDMAIFQFTKKIISGETIDLFNFGKYYRSFTYIDDVTTVISKLTEKILKSEYRFELPLLNVGNPISITTSQVLETIEEIVGRKAKIRLLNKMQSEMEITRADISLLQKQIGNISFTSFKNGYQKFYEWFVKYYHD